MLKNDDREKILKAVREHGDIMHKGIKLRITAGFSSEIMQAKKQWSNIFTVQTEKTCHLKTR